MTDPQPTGESVARPGDVVAQIESATARLDAELSDGMSLTELAERLTVLHGQLQGALSELDRT